MPEPTPDVLRKVARAAQTDAREAWRKSMQSSTLRNVREAYQTAVFAERALRKAAAVSSGAAAAAMIADADRIAEPANELKLRLARMIA